MKAVHLVSANNLQLLDIEDPPAPKSGEVLIEILSVGICGSDLHMYETAAIGTIQITEPMILGHEFSARIIAVSPDAKNENGESLEVGMRVAVEPHVSCGACEQCLEGNPNLCPTHYFYGVFPDHGALCERMIVRESNCFPIPDSVSNDSGALLEPLGVAIHSLDLAKLRIGDSVAIIGCGSIGSLIARLALMAGASKVYAFDLLKWRTDFAKQWGVEAYTVNPHDAPALINDLTNGRGVDVAIEAAWSNHTVEQSVQMVRYGGRLVMVGIPPDDHFSFGHSLARRKGLTIRLARRMKHTYPRAIALASGNSPLVPLDDLASHLFPLDDCPSAFQQAAQYVPGLIKALVHVNSF